MASTYTYEQSQEIMASYRARRAAKCPLCGGSIRFDDASTLNHAATKFECRGCGALDDSDREPDPE